MEKQLICLLTVMFTLATTPSENLMELEFINGRTGVCTQVNLKMVLSMATATGRSGRMVGRQIALKANMSLIKKMDKELSHGKVGMSIMEATWKTSGMGMERWLGLMDLPIKENGLKAYSTAEAL
jgi:hypothetical protein